MQDAFVGFPDVDGTDIHYIRLKDVYSFTSVNDGVVVVVSNGSTIHTGLDIVEFTQVLFATE